MEFDWSDKKEADELDTTCAILRNEDTNKQFYPGAARFQEMFVLYYSLFHHLTVVQNKRNIH